LNYWRKRNAKLRPGNLDAYIGMFYRIYRNTTGTLEEAFLHCAEEVGEVSRNIRLIEFGKKNGETWRELRSELSDTFSWMTKLIFLIKDMVAGLTPLVSGSINFSEILWQEYGNGCPRCKQPQCADNCPGYVKR
jgi:hypothetical protein